MLTNDGLAHRTGAPLQRSVMVGWTTFHGQVEPWEQEPVKPFRRTPPDPRHARLRCFAAASISLCILTVLCNFYWSNWSCTKDHGCYVRCGGCIHIYIYIRICLHTAHVLAYCWCFKMFLSDELRCIWCLEFPGRCNHPIAVRRRRVAECSA